MTYHDRIQRRRAATVRDVVRGVITAPYASGLSDLFVPAGVGRPRVHPGWAPLVYCALARHFTSYSRLDAELRDGLWELVRDTALSGGLADPGTKPFQFHHHTYWRDLVMLDDDVRTQLQEQFTAIAIEHARSGGLLLPGGPGSITHPHRRRVIYGDGTIVRPRFRPRPDGQTARSDDSAAAHHRHDGQLWGNNFVFFSARGDRPGSRLILAIDRVPTPGAEAATAVGVIQHIHRIAGRGILGVAYDGALQGAHIEQIMRTTGLVVINKMHLALRGDDPVHKRRALGIFEHEGPRRKRCTHQLVAINGRVADVELAEDGTPTVIGWAERQQVKRSCRGDGSYRFNMVVRLSCRHHGQPWNVWLSPHDDPENIRLLPPDDPEFAHLYGLRPDAESLNSAFKRALLVDRAPSVGWQRQLYDVLGFAILHNSRLAHR